MKARRPAHGYCPFVLPNRLADLERVGTVMEDGDLALIRAGRDSLVWSQRLDTGERAVFKMYRHRGPISWWREKHFRFRFQS